MSYRDIEEIFDDQNAKVDYSTLNRWVVKYSSSLALAAKTGKRTVATSWRVDETHLQVKGQCYLDRSVDKYGDIVEFRLFEKRDEAAVTAFLNRP